MLRNILLIAIPAVVVSLIVPTSSHCSKGCNCSEASVAVCDTLNLDGFDEHIYSLKIVHPKLPLILKGQPFNIRGLQNVNSISIENATILEIDKSAFTGIPLLSSFSIINSNIPSINHPLAFTAASNLKTITITNSTLTVFEFIKSHSLAELNLRGCKLTTITKNSFTNLPYLTYLNLADNNISQVDPLAFANLLDLQEVVLANNNISSLNPDLFQNNTELVTLDLSNNPFKTFDVNFVSDVEKLVLNSLNLESFSEKLRQDLYLLSYLDLSNNKINFSKAAFDKLEELEYIDLSNNGLKSLDSHIFKYNNKLQKVILDNNNFTVMPKFTSRNTSNFAIYFFSCKYCGLTSLPMDTFKHLPAIVILNLSNNQLNGINLTAIRFIPSLIELDLSYNNISVLNPLSFMISSGLEKLNLAGNPITTLDTNIFFGNRALKTLDLSFCKIQQLWKQPIKGKITSLLQLNIANNSISTIAPADMQVTPSIQVLDISNNPLQCDETLRDTITWLSEHHVSPASATPTWKTHESVYASNHITFIYSSNKSSWRDLAKQRCLDDHLFDNEEEEEEIEVLPPSKGNNFANEDADEYDEYDDYFDSDEEPTKSENLDDFGKIDGKFIEDDGRIDISELAFEATQFRKPTHSRYSFLWPTLVFIFTALSVLVIAANIMLLMLRTRMIPRHVNLPHIKIPQWNTSGKLKKHSGSVYQPLSEDKSEPCTPIITRKEQVPTHNSTPKSVV